MKPGPRIQDVAPLHTGGALIALGDEGVHHYARDGRLLRRWPFAARHLTVSDTGSSAIARLPTRQSPRGHFQTLHRLDLLDGSATFWCEAEFEVAAPTFDGRVWYIAPDEGVSTDSVIEGIDAQAPGFQRVVTGKKPYIWPLRFQRMPERLHLWTSTLGATYLDSYALPSLDHLEERLVELPALERLPLGQSGTEALQFLLRAEHVVDGAAPPFTQEPVFLIDSPRGNEPWGTSRLQDLQGTWTHAFKARGVGFTGAGRWAVVLLRHPTRCEVVCFDLEARQPGWSHRFMAHLPDYADPPGPVPSVDACGGLRIEGNHLAAWDVAGELVVLDLEAQRPTLSIRLLP